MKMEKLIEFRNIVKSFDGQMVLKGINLDIYENEFVTLLGPSGCGKTTLLRILAGFLPQDEGSVIFNGEEISDVPAYKRPINTVFQRYALFPHLNVYDNVAFGLRIKKMSEDLIKPKVDRMLDLVGLNGFQTKDVTLMSGGQQQRVAIARALVNEPDVLLLDEPLSALDAKLRKEMQQELKRIQEEVGITFIFVTHDQEEALTMSNKIVVFKDGAIEQIGTPTEIYNEPVNRYVANFIGQSNIIDGVMKKDYLVTFDDKDFECVDYDFNENEPVDVVIRPEDIEIKKKNQGVMNGQVLSVLFKGVHYEVIVETKRGASKKIKLHVMGNEDVYNQVANEKMSASDFTMDIEDVDSITDEDLILRSNAQAWNAETEDEIVISKVSHSIEKKAGKYPITFATSQGTMINVDVNVVMPKVAEDKDEKIGIQAFDVYKTIDEIQESMAISVDLRNWADAYAWDLETENEVEIDDVRFDFDPNEITEGVYDVEFVTEGRTYKIHTTEKQEEYEIVSISFGPEDIHIMRKMVG
ncbi:MAG: ABC transporter ATP-binding protein [Erysipelotrichaceae bacterium]|nr:ABC transporter ATP-binding protein [Erysipelotrichaceae bacterium]